MNDTLVVTGSGNFSGTSVGYMKVYAIPIGYSIRIGKTDLYGVVGPCYTDKSCKLGAITY